MIHRSGTRRLAAVVAGPCTLLGRRTRQRHSGARAAPSDLGAGRCGRDHKYSLAGSHWRGSTRCTASDAHCR
eukprot:scaffold28915_cov29-Tisochrysis_lutea.AAC.3